MYYHTISPADRDAPRATPADLDLAIDNACNTIGCPWEALDWSDDEETIFLTLPNCSTIEFDPFDDRSTIGAAELWDEYATISLYMASAEFASWPDPIAAIGYAAGVRFRVAVECRNDSYLRTSAIY